MWQAGGAPWQETSGPYEWNHDWKGQEATAGVEAIDVYALNITQTPGVLAPTNPPLVGRHQIGSPESKAIGRRTIASSRLCYICSSISPPKFSDIQH